MQGKGDMVTYWLTGKVEDANYATVREDSDLDRMHKFHNDAIVAF